MSTASSPPSQFDDRRVVYDGNFVAEDIDSFILQEQLPLVTVFSDEVGVASCHMTAQCNCNQYCNCVYIRFVAVCTHLQTAPKIFGGSVRSHLLAFYSGEAEEAEANMEELRTTAKLYKGEVSHVTQAWSPYTHLHIPRVLVISTCAYNIHACL